MGAILVLFAEMIPPRAVFGQGSYALIPIFVKIIHHSGACSTLAEHDKTRITKERRKSEKVESRESGGGLRAAPCKAVPDFTFWRFSELSPFCILEIRAEK